MNYITDKCPKCSNFTVIDILNWEEIRPILIRRNSSFRTKQELIDNINKEDDNCCDCNSREREREQKWVQLEISMSDWHRNCSFCSSNSDCCPLLNTKQGKIYKIGGVEVMNIR